MVNYTKEVGNIDTSFTTNAAKLNDRFVHEAMHNVSWIKVSFNGGDEESYAAIHRTQPKDYTIVLDNLRKANKYRIENKLKTTLGLQILLLPENSHTIKDLCLIAKEIGLDYVVVKPYSQHKFSNTQIYKDIDYSEYMSMGEELEELNDDKFNVVFRINTIKNWISQNQDRYCKCYSTPSTWAYWMADGSVYSCSAYLLDERFKLGNINDSSFDEIWCSEKRIEHAEFISNELDISECRVNCRMDQVNRYLDKIVNEKPEHFNFI